MSRQRVTTTLRSPARDWGATVADRLSGRGPLGPYETPPGKPKPKAKAKPRSPRAKRRVFD